LRFGEGFALRTVEHGRSAGFRFGSGSRIAAHLWPNYASAPGWIVQSRLGMVRSWSLDMYCWPAGAVDLYGKANPMLHNSMWPGAWNLNIDSPRV
jgi:hypothetical protein